MKTIDQLKQDVKTAAARYDKVYTDIQLGRPTKMKIVPARRALEAAEADLAAALAA